MDLTVDKIVNEDVLSDIKVMMVFNDKDDTMMLGAPYLDGVKVKVSVKEPLVQGDKIRVIKFRRKNRYTRTIGHRSKQSVLHISNIEVNG
jgi:ribosomal protein L21